MPEWRIELRTVPCIVVNRPNRRTGDALVGLPEVSNACVADWHAIEGEPRTTLEAYVRAAPAEGPPAAERAAAVRR